MVTGLRSRSQPLHWLSCYGSRIPQLCWSRSLKNSNEHTYNKVVSFTYLPVRFERLFSARICMSGSRAVILFEVACSRYCCHYYQQQNLKSCAKTTDFLLTRDSSIAITYLKLHLLLFCCCLCCLLFCCCLCCLLFCCFFFFFYVFCFFLCIYVFMLYVCIFAVCMIRVCAFKPARK
jgi:hypothetical protein